MAQGTYGLILFLRIATSAGHQGENAGQWKEEKPIYFIFDSPHCPT